MARRIQKGVMQTAQETLYANWEKYRGRHVLVVGNEILAAKTGKQALKLLKEIEERNPSASPLLTYIPKEGALILLVWR